jgi:hypothetical protein
MLIPSRPLEKDEIYEFPENEFESLRDISQEQLNSSKLYTSREEYIKTLPSDIRYMEIGVAWGYYSDLVCKIANPERTVLLDPFTQDLRCWSWRKFGECKCTPKHEQFYDYGEAEGWLTKEFSKYRNVELINGLAPEAIPTTEIFDYVYVDTTNDRYEVRNILNVLKDMVPVGGVIGLNDYTLYDFTNMDCLYGTPHAVNEFLHFNKNWIVDGLALHPVGFYDIYLRKNS